MWRETVAKSREQAIHVLATPITFTLGNDLDINARNTTAVRQFGAMQSHVRSVWVTDLGTLGEPHCSNVECDNV